MVQKQHSGDTNTDMRTQKWTYIAIVVWFLTSKPKTYIGVKIPPSKNSAGKTGYQKIMMKINNNNK
jgi:hypothetical protein